MNAVVFTIKLLWNRRQLLREDDRGMTTEAIVITGLLVAMAIIAIGFIATAVQNKAEDTGEVIEGTLGLI